MYGVSIPDVKCILLVAALACWGGLVACEQVQPPTGMEKETSVEPSYKLASPETAPPDLRKELPRQADCSVIAHGTLETQVELPGRNGGDHGQERKCEALDRRDEYNDRKTVQPRDL